MSAHDDGVQWREARRWFAKAMDDLRLARLALAADPPIVDGAAYHCQQSAEKVLKGLLITRRVKAARTHDMVRLTEAVAAQYPALADTIAPFAAVTSWGIETRYPELSPEVLPSEADVREMIGRCAGLLDAVAALGPRG